MTVSLASPERSTQPLAGAEPLLTIFAIPKSFAGHIGTIQQNAIKSWTRLEPTPQIILLGDDYGVAELAREIGAIHCPAVEKSSYGTPLLKSVFSSAANLAKGKFMAYVNSDIILLNDFMPTLKSASESFSNFVLIGQRCDLDLAHELDFSIDGWEPGLRKQAAAAGKLAGPRGMDYFCFPRGRSFQNIPDFAIGRGYWDNWLVFEALRSCRAVLDATGAITVIHQNHAYVNLPGNFNGSFVGGEADCNFKVMTTAQGTDSVGLSSYADFEFKEGKIVKRTRKGECLDDYEKLIAFARPEFGRLILLKREFRIQWRTFKAGFKSDLKQWTGRCRNLWDQLFARVFHEYDKLRRCFGKRT